jgi:hypothetical protein
MCRDNILCEPGGICRITEKPIGTTGKYAKALKEVHEQNHKNMGTIVYNRYPILSERVEYEVVCIDDCPKIGFATELYKDINSKVAITLHNNRKDVTIHLWDKERGIENKIILKMPKFEE